MERLLESSEDCEEKLSRPSRTGRNRALVTSNSTDSTGLNSCCSSVSSQSTQTDDFVLDHMIPSDDEVGVLGGVLKKLASFYR